MDKIKEVLKYVMMFFYFAMIGFMAIILITGAFQFAVAFIEDRSPVFLEWFCIIFVDVILGFIGLVCFIINDKE